MTLIEYFGKAPYAISFVYQVTRPVWYPGLIEYIGATSFPATSVVRGLAFCVYCIRFSCLSLLSCAELCAFLCPLVLFTLMISFGSKGFPYKNQIEESFVVVVNCVSPNIYHCKLKHF